MTTTTNGTTGSAVAAGTASMNISLTQIRFRCWTGERQVSDEEAAQLLNAVQDESNYKLVKKLIDKDILRYIQSIQHKAKSKITKYCLRFPLTNVLAVPKVACDTIEHIVEVAKADMRQAVEIMINGGQFKLTQKTTKTVYGWDDLIHQARNKLGPAFRAQDYPTADQLRDKFDIDMMPFFDLTPSSTKQHSAMDDIIRQFKDEATAVLRGNFLGMMNKMAEKLEDKYDPKTGEIKRQKLYDSMLEDLSHFLKWVDHLNVGNDEAIITMVSRCKEVLDDNGLLKHDGGVDVYKGMGKLKDVTYFRRQMKDAFESIGSQFQPTESNNGKEIVKKENNKAEGELVGAPLGGVTINKKQKSNIDSNTGLAKDLPF